MIAGLLTDVPVTPDGPTAQRWAVEELSQPEYRERRSLLSRLMERVLGWFDNLGGTGLSGTTSALVVVGALVVVVAVAFIVAGPVRRSRRLRSATDGAVRAAGDVRTADQMRAAADAAARSGDFSLAVVERFRAVVHGLEERLVIDERVGRTAHEAGVDAGYRLPALAAELAGVAALFDDVAYGGRPATPDDDARVRTLDEQARHERPTTRADTHAAGAPMNGAPTSQTPLAATAAPVVGDGTTARSRSAGRWRRWRGPIAVLAVIALVGLLAALPAPRVSNLPLAPNSTAPTGARAAAQILEREGVDVTFVRRLAQVRAADGADTTILLAGEEGVDLTQLDALGDLQADLVLVDAEYAASTLAGIEYTWDENGDAVELEPRCDDADAAAAGTIVARGRVLATTPGVVTCFRDADDDAATGFYAVTTGVDGRRIAVLADSGPLTNQHLAEAGNAALVLRTLGRHNHLVWYLPSPYDTGGGAGGPRVGDLVPPWVGVLGLQLLLVATVVALWRGRRMGRLVTEPMPVVVRATEATRGRGRLYRRSRAHGHAAAALRAGAATRCASRLGLAASTPAQQLIDAVALATGRSTADVADLFYGPPPTDDSALATLARNLDDIESEVHRS